MFERDYLVRMLVDLAAAIRRALDKSREAKDLEGACETLENSITNATDLDGAVLMTLAPESIASVLQVANTDPRVVIYVAHSMQLQAHYLRQLNNDAMADLRQKQARALAHAYKFELPEKIDEVDDELFNDEEFLKSIEELCEA